MVRLVHIAPEPELKKIRRNGINASRLKGWIGGYDRFVWTFPVLESYTLTHQWMRELKRGGQATLVAVTIKIPDSEPVFVRHFNNHPAAATAAEAVGNIRAQDDARGYEIIIPRRIESHEIAGARVLPRAIGWRYFPDAKNKPLKSCDCPYCMPRGEVKAARYRSAVRETMARHGLKPYDYTDPDDDEDEDDDEAGT